MSELFQRLSGSAVGQVPSVTPAPLSRFAPPAGLVSDPFPFTVMDNFDPGSPETLTQTELEHTAETNPAIRKNDTFKPEPPEAFTQIELEHAVETVPQSRESDIFETAPARESTQVQQSNPAPTKTQTVEKDEASFPHRELDPPAVTHLTPTIEPARLSPNETPAMGDIHEPSSIKATPGPDPFALPLDPSSAAKEPATTPPMETAPESVQFIEKKTQPNHPEPSHTVEIQPVDSEPFKVPSDPFALNPTTSNSDPDSGYPKAGQDQAPVGQDEAPPTPAKPTAKFDEVGPKQEPQPSLPAFSKPSKNENEVNFQPNTQALPPTESPPGPRSSLNPEAQSASDPVQFKPQVPSSRLPGLEASPFSLGSEPVDTNSPRPSMPEKSLLQKRESQPTSDPFDPNPTKPSPEGPIDNQARTSSKKGVTGRAQEQVSQPKTRPSRLLENEANRPHGEPKRAQQPHSPPPAFKPVDQSSNSPASIDFGLVPPPQNETTSQPQADVPFSASQPTPRSEETSIAPNSTSPPPINHRDNSAKGRPLQKRVDKSNPIQPPQTNQADPWHHPAKSQESRTRPQSESSPPPDSQPSPRPKSSKPVAPPFATEAPSQPPNYQPGDNASSATPPTDPILLPSGESVHIDKVEFQIIKQAPKPAAAPNPPPAPPSTRPSLSDYLTRRKGGRR